LALGLLLSSAAPGQHLGDVICRADAVVVGTIVAIKPQPAPAGRSAVVMTVKVEQRLKGPADASVLDLTLEAEHIPSHLKANERRIFLLRAGKLIRIELEESIAVTRNLLADRSLCAPK
jgi:hypothetical protein